MMLVEIVCYQERIAMACFYAKATEYRNDVNKMRAEFGSIGSSEVAYVKQDMNGDKIVWGIYSGDGARVAVAENRELAFAMIKQNELEPLDAH